MAVGQLLYRIRTCHSHPFWPRAKWSFPKGLYIFTKYYGLAHLMYVNSRHLYIYSCKFYITELNSEVCCYPSVNSHFSDRKCVVSTHMSPGVRVSLSVRLKLVANAKSLPTFQL